MAMIFGERVRQVREYHGLTQRELAERLGISQAAVYSIESDRLKPAAELVETLAMCTGFLPGFFARPPEPFSEGTLFIHRATGRIREEVWQTIPKRKH